MELLTQFKNKFNKKLISLIKKLNYIQFFVVILTF